MFTSWTRLSGSCSNRETETVSQLNLHRLHLSVKNTTCTNITYIHSLEPFGFQVNMTRSNNPVSQETKHHPSAT